MAVEAMAGVMANPQYTLAAVPQKTAQVHCRCHPYSVTWWRRKEFPPESMSVKELPERGHDGESLPKKDSPKSSFSKKYILPPTAPTR